MTKQGDTEQLVEPTDSGEKVYVKCPFCEEVITICTCTNNLNMKLLHQNVLAYASAMPSGLWLLTADAHMAKVEQITCSSVISAGILFNDEYLGECKLCLRRWEDLPSHDQHAIVHEANPSIEDFDEDVQMTAFDYHHSAIENGVLTPTETKACLKRSIYIPGLIPESVVHFEEGGEG